MRTPIQILTTLVLLLLFAGKAWAFCHIEIITLFPTSAASEVVLEEYEYLPYREGQQADYAIAPHRICLQEAADFPGAPAATLFQIEGFAALYLESDAATQAFEHALAHPSTLPAEQRALLRGWGFEVALAEK